MKYKEIKCKNCGALINVQEGAKTVKCEYCGTSFEIEDSYDTAYKRAKGAMDALYSNPIAKGSRVVSIVMAVAFILIFGFAGYTIFNGITTQTKEASLSKFNFMISGYSGSVNGDRAKLALQEVIDSNSTKKRQISVTYNGVTTKDADEIRKIKLSLVDSFDDNYEIIFKYDSDGYINNLTLEDIK